MPEEELQIEALDGVKLAADLVEPASGAGPRAAVVIASAMGVPRKLYRAFARYLAEDGIASLSFDYRGIGGSGSVRDRKIRLRDWGEQDLGGALSFLRRRYPGTPQLLF